MNMLNAHECREVLTIHEGENLLTLCVSYL